MSGTGAYCLITNRKNRHPADENTDNYGQISDQEALTLNSMKNQSALTLNSVKNQSALTLIRCKSAGSDPFSVKVPITIAVFLILFLYNPVYGDSIPTVIIRKDLNLSAGEIIPLIPENFIAGEEQIRIVIYVFTRGTEQYSYSSGGELQITQTGGLLEALVTRIRENRIEKAVFVTARGDTKEEILADFGNKVRDVLSRF